MPYIERLEATGLLLHDKQTDKLAITPQFVRIQGLLGISLTELIERTEVATVKPFLGLPSLERHDLAELFVLMPFDPHLQTLYTHHISQVAARLEIRVKRSDDFFTANSIIYDIWAAI